jgi:hypothetical protein
MGDAFSAVKACSRYGPQSGLDFAIKSGGKSNYNLFALMLDGEVFNLTSR